jgi:chromosomal replication initiation ATPase DnaA
VTVSRQLPFDFPHRVSLSGEDFLVAPCNAGAVAWIDRWPDWPAPVVTVYGPAACGKTHLLHVFLARTGGQRVTASDLSAGQAMPLAVAAAALALDDAEDVLAEGHEAALLHLYNAAGEAGRCLLLTARRPPVRWPVGLADLRSRLNAAAAVAIGSPDEALIGALLVKLFADRQMRVEHGVVTYLLARMERSFDAARGLVAALDRAALAGKRPVTLALARQVLREAASEEQ